MLTHTFAHQLIRNIIEAKMNDHNFLILYYFADVKTRKRNVVLINTYLYVK